MNFPCIVYLLTFSYSFKIVPGQRIKFEDEYTTTPSSHKVQQTQEEFDGESRSIGESDYDNDKHSIIGGSSNNELVSKQYYPQPQPPGFPPPPGFHPQYNNNQNIFSVQQSNGNGGGGGGGTGSWQWSGSVTTQQSRKPHLVQFQGESYTVSSTSFSSYSSNSNSGRQHRGPVSSSAIRIDENCHCGTIPYEKDTKKLQRVVGGIVSENSWPWMVAITYIGQTKPFWFCGGSLISEKFVLTAAHCLRTIRNFGLSNVKLIMGTNNLFDNKSAVYYSIRALRPHPLYKSGTEDYDMALLEIKERVNFTSRVSPICLQQVGEPFINRTVTVAGWGSLQNGEGPPSDLREVDLKVVSNDMCQKEYYINYRTSVTSSMLCAWLPGKDSCQGDSGGPLFMKTTFSPYAYTQIGIVSFGPPACGKTTIPGVYSRVSSAVRWIKSTAKSGRFCKGSF